MENGHPVFPGLVYFQQQNSPLLLLKSKTVYSFEGGVGGGCG